MKLEQYLQGLRECPDELIEVPRAVSGTSVKQEDGTIKSVIEYEGTKQISLLKYRFGIRDNWPVLLNQDYGEFLRTLESLEKWTNPKIYNEKTRVYEFIPGTVVMQVENRVRTPYGNRSDIERQKRDYNMQLMFHPYQERKIIGADNDRAMAIAICVVGDHLLKNNIPTCMNSTSPFESLQDDFSHIIYFPDSVDDEMQRLRETGVKQ